MTYRQRISKATGCTPDEARMVEGWMRLERSTLDAMDATAFASVARSCLKDVRRYPDVSAKLAETYGL